MTLTTHEASYIIVLGIVISVLPFSSTLTKGSVSANDLQHIMCSISVRDLIDIILVSEEN